MPLIPFITNAKNQFNYLLDNIRLFKVTNLITSNPFINDQLYSKTTTMKNHPPYYKNKVDVTIHLFYLPYQDLK